MLFDSLLAQQLTRCRAGLTIHVAAAQPAPFLNFAQGTAAFGNKLIRSSPESLLATLAA